LIQVDEGDGSHDVVDCGPGQDTVFFDQVVDTVVNCERLNPR
jgi:hypothetical protein